MEGEVIPAAREGPLRESLPGITNISTPGSFQFTRRTDAISHLQREKRSLSNESSERMSPRD